MSGQSGLLMPGNIDLHARPVARNADGSVSTVRSISVNVDGRETLIPTVSDDGRVLSDSDAVDQFRRTGKHLGIFDSPASANAYAQQLHQDQEREYVPQQQARDQNPYPTSDPAKEVLDRLGDLPNKVRASAWDAFHQSKDQEAFRASMDALPLPKETKAALWDAKFGTHPKGVGEQVTDAGKTFLQTINPVKAVESMGRALIPQVVGDAIGLNNDPTQVKTGPLNTLMADATARRAVSEKGGVANQLYSWLPFIGPSLSQAGDELQRGDVGAGVGRSLGVGVGLFGPTAAAKSGLRLPATFKNPNPAERAAVAFGQREGIPVDAGTATGNPFVRGSLALSERTIGGSVVGRQARQSQANAFQRVGEEQATRAHPQPVNPEQAGQAVQDAVTRKVEDFHGEATAAYDKVRAAEANPANARRVQTGSKEFIGVDASGQPVRRMDPIYEDMPLPVDMRAAKAALKPILDRLSRQLPVTQQRSSPGLKAIENVVNGPDYSPLSVADMDLSAIKALARGADLPELRSVSQGIAATAVQQLDTAVMGTAQLAGPDVIAGLQSGRAATVAKYGAADVLKGIRDEPVQAFRQAIYANDAGIEQLRDVARLAPSEMPKVGRAYLDDLLTKAGSEGGFDHAARLAADWQRLGPQTKQLLFQDPAYIRDLDSFFMLAKKAAENPNPSGTAFVGAIGAQGWYLMSDPLLGGGVQIAGASLAKLLHSPRIVRAMTDGMRVSVGNRAAATAAVSEVVAGARELGIHLAPAPAKDRQPAGPLTRGLPASSAK